MNKRNSLFLTGNGEQIDLKLASGQLFADPDILLQRIEAGGLVTLKQSDFYNSFSRDSVLTLQLLQSFSLIGQPLGKNDGLLEILAKVSSENIRSIILKAVEKHLLRNSPGPDYTVNMELNLYARRMSIASGIVAKQLQYHAVAQAELAGLLFNIGKLVLLSQAQGRQFNIFTQKVSNESLIAEEQKEFHTDHVLIAEELLDSLGLPSEIIDAVCYGAMSYTRASNASMLVKIICFSNLLISEGFENQQSVIDAGKLLLGLSHKEVSQLSLNVQKVFAGLQEERRGYEGQKQRLEAGLAKSSVEYLLSERIWQASNFNELTEVLRDWFLTNEGVEEVIIFLPNSEKSFLNAYGQEFSDGDYLQRNAIPLEQGVSLVSHCFLHHEAVNTFQVESWAEMIIDLQLIRRCKSEGFLCLPVLHNSESCAVVLLGLNKKYLTTYENSELTSFYFESFSKALGKLSNKNTSRNHAAERLPLRKIKHELSNPLTVASNKIFLLKQKYPELENDLLQLEVQQDRIKGIIEYYLEPLKSTRTTVPTSINDILIDIVENIPLKNSSTVDITMELAHKLPSLSLNEIACRQIFINLLKNAIEACEGSTSRDGKVTITSNDMFMSEDKYWIEVIIKDNGSGIDPEIMKCMFQPINSTKAGDHAGLGLSIVKSLCDEIGARVSCRSYQGRGTEFSILIPRPLTELLETDI